MLFLERTVYSYVAVIGVDGMGNFNKNADTPNIDEIFKDGAVTYNALSMNPTISAENWGAMLLGANPTVHKLTNGIVSRNEYTNNELPSVFTIIRKAMPGAYLASCSNWNPINHGIIEHDIDVDFYTNPSDIDLCADIENCVAKKPTFLFVQFDNVDGAGHKNNYGSQKHIEQIEITDKLIGRIADAYKNAGIFEDTLFIVTADHGGYIHSHGGYHDTEKYVFLAARGKGINKSNIKTAQTKDISAIVLYALGIDSPEYDIMGYSSQIPDGLFPEVSGKYYIPEKVNYNPDDRKTPELNSEKGLFSFIPKDRVKLACFFDNNLDDATGNYSFKEQGLVKFYTNGIYGENGEFGVTGCASCADIKFDNSFSISMWLKIDPTMCEDLCVAGTRDWTSEERYVPGFNILMHATDTSVYLSDDSEHRTEIVTAFKEGIKDGWVHIIYSFDFENLQLKVYNNFELVHNITVGDWTPNAFNGLDFTIGDDASKKQNKECINALFNMDDLFIFDGVISKEDVQNLKKYYNF